jgi:hypothetical protein
MPEADNSGLALKMVTVNQVLLAASIYSMFRAARSDLFSRSRPLEALSKLQIKLPTDSLALFVQSMRQREKDDW